MTRRIEGETSPAKSEGLSRDVPETDLAPRRCSNDRYLSHPFVLDTNATFQSPLQSHYKGAFHTYISL